MEIIEYSVKTETFNIYIFLCELLGPKRRIKWLWKQINLRIFFSFFGTVWHNAVLSHNKILQLFNDEFIQSPAGHLQSIYSFGFGQSERTAKGNTL